MSTPNTGLGAAIGRLVLIEGVLLAIAAILLVVTQNVVFVYVLIAIAILMGPYIIWTLYKHRSDPAGQDRSDTDLQA